MIKYFRYIFIVLLLMIFQPAMGTCRILRLNTPYITVDGKQRYEGDIIAIDAEIKWENENQAVRLIDIDSKKQYLLAAKMSRKNRSNKIKDLLVSSVQLSSRSAKPATFAELAMQLPDSIYILSDIQLAHNIPCNDYRFFYASYRYGDEIINKRLSTNTDGMVIDSELLRIDGRYINVTSVNINIYYFDETKQQTTLIKSNMFVSFLPEKVD